MQPSGAPQPPTTEALRQAARFLIEVRRRPELRRRLQDEVLDIDDLVALGRELGLRFDGQALQQAFRNDALLRMGIGRIAGDNLAKPDR